MDPSPVAPLPVGQPTEVAAELAAVTVADQAEAARRHAARNLRWNSICFISDSVTFGIAVAFLNQSTVLPTFVSHLTDSVFLVGLVATIQSGAWLLPQLLAASLVAGQPRKKPLLVAAICVGRPAYLLLAGAVLLLGDQNPALLLALFYLALLVFGVSDGIATPPWLDILGRAIPARRRGRVLGIGQMISGVVGVAVGGVVGLILSSPALAFPNNYALLFAIAGVIYLINIIADAALREPPAVALVSEPVEKPGLRALIAIVGPALRADRRLVGVIVARLLFGAGVLVFPFYVVFASKSLGFGVEQIGLFLSAQVVGGILGGMLYGQLADRRGPRAALRAAIPIAAVAPGLALLAGALGDVPAVLRLAVMAGSFVSVGLCFSAYMLGFMNYLLEIAPEHDRSAYAGVFNTINGALLVVPATAGWFVEITSFEALFGLALVALALAFAVSLTLGEAGRGHGTERIAK